MANGNMSVDEFMSRIAGIESQGADNPYTVTNARTGAHGKFQIMQSNWSPWAQEVGLPANAPRTAANQERIARAKLSQYRQQYGSWEAAAVAWFAGPNRAKRFSEGDESVLNLSDGNMTVGEYVDRVRGDTSTVSQPAPPALGGNLGGDQRPEDADTPLQGAQSGRVRDLWTHAIQSMSRQIRDGVGEDIPLGWTEPQPDEPIAPGVEGDPEMPGDLGIESSGQLEASGSAPASSFLEAAQQFVGTPYLWGGTDPGQGFDCSGLIQYAAKQVGVNLPRVSRDQARAGQEVPLGQAQPGDLIAFPARGQEVGHIGILVGRDEQGRWQMLHAPRSGTNVRIEPVGRRQIATVRRIFDPDGGALAPDGTGPARTTTPSTRPSQQAPSQTQTLSGPTPQTGQPRPKARRDENIPL